MREEYKHLAPLMRKEEYMAAILAELCKLNDNIEKFVKSNEPKQPTPQAKKTTEKIETEQKEAVTKKSTTTRKSTPKKKDEV